MDPDLTDDDTKERAPLNIPLVAVAQTAGGLRRMGYKVPEAVPDHARLAFDDLQPLGLLSPVTPGTLSIQYKMVNPRWEWTVTHPAELEAP